MQIDYTEYVETTTEPNLKFGDEKQQATFELGVSMAVHSWDNLQTAVDNNWGGANSAEKRDWIAGIVVDLFANEKVVDIALIEETLLYAMLDEFEVQIEDESGLLVAKNIMDCYKSCYNKEYNGIREAYMKWEKRQSEKRQVNKVTIQGDDEDDEDDDDEDADNDEEIPDLDGEPMQVDEPVREEPVVDDDGFELVQKKGRGGRRH